jgi:hypothetical protein
MVKNWRNSWREPFSGRDDYPATFGKNPVRTEKLRNSARGCTRHTSTAMLSTPCAGQTNNSKQDKALAMFKSS